MFTSKKPTKEFLSHAGPMRSDQALQTGIPKGALIDIQQRFKVTIDLNPRTSLISLHGAGACLHSNIFFLLHDEFQELRIDFLTPNIARRDLMNLIRPLVPKDHIQITSTPSLLMLALKFLDIFFPKNYVTVQEKTILGFPVKPH